MPLTAPTRTAQRRRWMEGSVLRYEICIWINDIYLFKYTYIYDIYDILKINDIYLLALFICVLTYLFIYLFVCFFIYCFFLNMYRLDNGMVQLAILIADMNWIDYQMHICRQIWSFEKWSKYIWYYRYTRTSAAIRMQTFNKQCQMKHHSSSMKKSEIKKRVQTDREKLCNLLQTQM